MECKKSYEIDEAIRAEGGWVTIIAKMIGSGIIALMQMIVMLTAFLMLVYVFAFGAKRFINLIETVFEWLPQ